MDSDLGTLLFPARDRVMAPAIAATGTWEPLECTWLEKHLQEGQTFLNIGANVGYHVLRASRLVGPTGKVIAIETEPVNFALLLANVAFHDLRNVVPIRCAAGSRSARLRLYRAEDNSGDNRLTRFPERRLRSKSTLSAWTSCWPGSNSISPLSTRRAPTMKLWPA